MHLSLTLSNKKSLLLNINFQTQALTQLQHIVPNAQQI